jgi:SAM-dependent methyltransferase
MPQPEPPPLDETLRKMREDWDARARENARYYVHTGRQDWNEEEFYRTGQLTIEQQITNDPFNIFQGRDPRRMKVLEIGCGAGRITRALGTVFGEVHAVDVSGEMVKLARQALASMPHVHIYQNNGKDLRVLGNQKDFDFAFSMIVFQHIPSREVIESYVREVHRVLRPGSLFKFQVQGAQVDEAPEDTWHGVPFTDAEAVDLGLRCGFLPRYRVGANDQYFWLWYFRQRWPRSLITTLQYRSGKYAQRLGRYLVRQSTITEYPEPPEPSGQ